MEAKEIQKALLDLYQDLMTAGKVRTKGEFAELMGVGRNSLSLAMNGSEKSLTSSLYMKAQALRRRELEGNTSNLPSNRPSERDEEKNGVFIPRETLKLYESLSKTAETLASIVQRMMPGSMPVETGRKKDYYPEQ